VHVVLKILVLDGESAPDALQQFEREAAIAARLRHMNIAAAEPVEQHGDVAYYAMNLDYVGSAETFCFKQPPPTFDESVALLRDVASALDYAHAHHTVHGRLAPSMIFLDVDDQVIVSGFGSSVGPGAANRSISPAYLAPEQWPALPGEDGRVDVFALGVIAFELVSGKRRDMAFASPDGVAIEPFAISPNTPLRKGVSLGVNDAIARAISNKPSLRFATAGEFVSALEEAPAPRGFRLSPLRADRSLNDLLHQASIETLRATAPRSKQEPVHQEAPLPVSPPPTDQGRQPPAPQERQPPSPYVRQPPSPLVRQPLSQQVRQPPLQSVNQPSSQPVYKPVYRPLYQEHPVQWKPPYQNEVLPESRRRRGGDVFKMVVMTIVFLVIMAALSGPEFLQAVAARTGLSFLIKLSPPPTRTGTNNGAIAPPSDSLVKAHPRRRRGVKSSSRVATPAKKNSAVSSPSSTLTATADSSYGFVRVVLKGDSQPVLIDGVPHGNTPLIVRLPTGAHSISLVGTQPVQPQRMSLTLTGRDTALASFSAVP
jgi:serine/threonine protein kinase